MRNGLANIAGTKIGAVNPRQLGLVADGAAFLAAHRKGPIQKIMRRIQRNAAQLGQDIEAFEARQRRRCLAEADRI